MRKGFLKHSVAHRHPLELALANTLQFSPSSDGGSGVSMKSRQFIIRLCLLTLFGWLANVSIVSAADFLVQNWDVRNGLSGAAITSIAQTPDGFLWLATRNGIDRFDGNHFRHFNPPSPANGNSNAVITLLNDRIGNLWIGTTNGLWRLARGVLEASEAQPVVPEISVASLAEAADGTIRATVPRLGIVAVSQAGQIMTTNHLEISDNAQIVVTAQQQIWLESNSSLWLGETNGWSPVKISGAVNRIAAALDGGLWYAVETQFFKLGQTAAFGEPAPSRISALCEDATGRMWIGTRGGGVFYYSSDGKLHRSTAIRSRLLGGVTSLFAGANGEIWVGMSLGSLQCVRPRLVSALRLPDAARESLPHTVCAARDGEVWGGTDGMGVFRYRDGAFQKVDFAAAPEMTTVVAIYEDRQTNLWIGGLGGLFRYDRSSGLITKSDLLRERLVSAIFEDRAGNLWIGGSGQLACVRDGKVISYRFYEKARNGQLHEIRAIAEDASGKIWVGTRAGGLFYLQADKLEHADELDDAAVFALHADSDGGLWIGSCNRGLFYLKDGRAQHWKMAQGLPDDTVYAILEDAAGVLWMSCNEGIYGLSKTALLHFDPAAGIPLLPRQLTHEDGLLDSACLASGQPAAARSDDGRFWFPTTLGIASFRPDEINREHHANVNALIEGVSVEGVWRPLLNGSEVEVAADTRRFEFRFTAPAPESPAQQKLRYRLKGLDDDWTLAGASQEASYGRLAPGQYEFQVMAGNQGQWPEQPASMKIRVVPGFWERRLVQGVAMTILLCAVVIVVQAINQSRERRRQQALELKQAIEREAARSRQHVLELKAATERERSRIAKDLHDDIGTGLTEIISLSELARNTTGNQEAATAHVKSITTKTRQLAVAMDEVVWTANPTNDTLPKLAGYIADFAQEFLLPTPVKCRLDIEADLPALNMAAPRRHNIFLAVKEALNNAVRHAHASELWIRIRWQVDTLHIIIEDNGCGIKPAAGVPFGNGLENMQTRLASAGGRVEIKSQPEAGTTVHFILRCLDDETVSGGESI